MAVIAFFALLAIRGYPSAPPGNYYGYPFLGWWFFFPFGMFLPIHRPLLHQPSGLLADGMGLEEKILVRRRARDTAPGVRSRRDHERSIRADEERPGAALSSGLTPCSATPNQFIRPPPLSRVGVLIRRAKRTDTEQFVGLVSALAKFEHLKPPSAEGRRRLVDDIFRKRRVNLLVASDGGSLVGYALYFFNYSSFVAKPSLYLEDIFVLKEHRKRGAGFALFRKCVDIALARGCGRMEWAVLTWNEKALRFYDGLGARRMSDWFVYRLDEQALRRVPRKV